MDASRRKNIRSSCASEDDCDAVITIRRTQGFTPTLLSCHVSNKYRDWNESKWLTEVTAYRVRVRDYNATESVLAS